VPIKFIYIFPRPGPRPPNSGESFLISESVEDVEAGSIAYKGYLFEKEWELVPGT
jgi:hypothetical protein